MSILDVDDNDIDKDIIDRIEKQENSNKTDKIEFILNKIALNDWSVENKINILPNNKLILFLENIIGNIFCIIFVLIPHLIFIYLLFHIIIFSIWLIRVLLSCWIWRNKEFKSFNDYKTIFIMKEIEDLHSININKQNGIIWNIRYYIITFIDGINAFILTLNDKNNNQYKINYYKKRIELNENKMFIGSDGGINCIDYNYALKHYSNPNQLHEFATRYVMHPVVLKWCPLYSLGQNAGTKTHKFVREIHYNIDKYLVDNFEKHKIPNDLYIPSFTDNNNKTISINECFAYSLATFYYKLFQKRLSNDDIQVFKNCRSGLLSIGVLPNMLINMMGYKIFIKKYWKMLSKFRQLILTKHINHYIPRMIIETAKKYQFNTEKEFDYAFNSFIIELLPGNAGIAGVLNTALYYLNDNKENRINEFICNPENFVLECLRMSGLPSSGRTILSEYENNDFGITLQKGQAIIHTFDLINRCPYMFKNPHSFNSKRNNLKKDLFIFGNKEEFIRNKSAKRSCPLHNYAIKQIQELISRLYQLSMSNSFELNDNKTIKFKKEKNNLKISKKIHNSLNKYEKYIIPPLLNGVKKWNKNPPINVPGYINKLEKIKKTDDEDNIMQLSELTKDRLFEHYVLPKWDEDLERDRKKDVILKLFSYELIFPIVDDTELFNNNEEMKKWRDEYIVMPKINVVWNELISDHAMSLFAFESIGCLYTKKIDNKDISISHPDNAVYQNDWRFLSEYEVRNGLERYGSIAYFDAEYKIIAIYVSFLDEIYYPGDRLWEYSKYVWKTCNFVGVTIADHAINAHIIESNNLVTATREELPLNHPFRRLFDIFTYRTIFINYGVKATLLGNNMLIERISGFTFDSIEKVSNDLYDSYEFKPLHEKIDKSMRSLPDEIYPINSDSAQIFECMEYLIKNYINIYYKNENEFITDKYIKSFYNKLRKSLKLKLKLSIKSFIYLVSGLITNVTAYHELVGAVMDIAGNDISWVDTKIYKNSFDKLQQSKNDFAATCAVVMLTGLRNPSILNDFTHVLIKDDNYEIVQNLFNNWQEKLKHIANEIEEKNKFRRIPFNACNPNVMECSVNI